MFHRSCLNKAYSGVVLSIGQDESSKISERIQNMPTFNGFQWEYQSSRRVKPVGGGNIYFRPSTDNAARSLPSVNDILIDEADFIPNADKIYSAATPSQKMAGDKAQIFVVSTISEKGEFGWFGQLFSKYNPDGLNYLDRIEKIRRGKGEHGAGFDWWIDETGWCKVLMHWRSHPIYSFIPDFLEKTKRDERLSEDQLQREYNLGIEIVQLGEKPYKRFNPVLHVLKGRDLAIAVYNPYLPLHVSLDFNHHPACAIAAQKNEHGEAIVLREWYLQHSDTFVLAESICEWIQSFNTTRWIFPVEIHGDASGNQKTANSKQTNWQIVLNQFRKMGIPHITKYGKANPGIQDTLNACSWVFEESLIFVPETCPELIKDFIQLQYKKGTLEIDKSSDLARSHLSDCFRYLIWDLYGLPKVPKKYQGGGKSKPVGIMV
jgi:hypothetical protein